MSRRRAREIALQVLFQIDLGRAAPEVALQQTLARPLEEEESQEQLSEKNDQFMKSLVLGTWEHKEEIDREITHYAKEWTVDRMACVDRNILRMAIYELTYHAEIPASATADEAVELAKAFSTSDSGKFVNGILGSIIRDLRREASSTESSTS